MCAVCLCFCRRVCRRLTELTWHRVLHGAPGRGSLLPRHVNATEPYDPNNELSEQGTRKYLLFRD